MVRCCGLAKRYGDFEALVDLCLSVPRGSVFGLLGPNGAGKTTLIRLLLGFLRRSGGRCTVDGFDPATDGVEVRRRAVYLPGDARLPRHMRGRSVLKFFAQMHPAGDFDRSLEVADRLELDLRRHVAFMSTGMRQKLALAVVFAPHTPLLILDEPTANLDPSVRSTVLKLVADARQQQRTVLLSSHILSEIEQTCDQVAFLRRGRLARTLSLSELAQRHRITARPPYAVTSVPAALRDQVKLTGSATGASDRLQIDTTGDLAAVLPWLDSLELTDLRIEPLGLRTIYEAVHGGEEAAL